jgi:hypothetical protein
MNDKIPANCAFCLCCGDRIGLPNAGAVVNYCSQHRTAEGRAKHHRDQAALVKEREGKLKPAVA